MKNLKLNGCKEHGAQIQAQTINDWYSDRGIDYGAVAVKVNSRMGIYGIRSQIVLVVPGGENKRR